MDDLLLEFALEIHRDVKTGKLTMLDCFNVLKRMPDVCVPIQSPGSCDRGSSGNNAGTSTASVNVRCPQCHDTVSGLRFAQHLEKCLTGGGRTKNTTVRYSVSGFSGKAFDGDTSPQPSQATSVNSTTGGTTVSKRKKQLSKSKYAAAPIKAGNVGLSNRGKKKNDITPKDEALLAECASALEMFADSTVGEGCPSPTQESNMDNDASNYENQFMKEERQQKKMLSNYRRKKMLTEKINKLNSEICVI